MNDRHKRENRIRHCLEQNLQTEQKALYRFQSRFARAFGHCTFEDLFGKRNEIRFQGIVISLPVKGKIKSAANLPNVYAFQFHFKGTWTGGIRLDRSTFIVQRPFNRVQMIWSFFSGICRKINRLFVNKIKFFRILYNVKIRVKIRVELFE